MNKTKLVLIGLLVFLLVSLLTYLNYDKILHYFTNREWELADSLGKIEVENYIGSIGTTSHYFVMTNNGVEGYAENLKNVFQLPNQWKEVVSSSAGDYWMVAEKNGSEVYVICKNEKVWNATINNANILGVTINKNGYSAVIYSQTAYKSLIKVYSNTGEELFTSYLASTYAIDVAISNDNKTIAIAEVDTNGINLVSAIKLIDVQNASENNVKKYDLENDELISDVEFDADNQLIIMTDANVKILKNGEITNFINFKEENILVANIQHPKNLIAIQTIEEGLFSVKCYVCIYSYHDSKHKNVYEIEETPTKIETMGDIIAVDMGSEIVFLNTAGHFVKKSEYHGQLKDFKLFHNGNIAVLLFRNTAEFVKVGGM